MTGKSGENWVPPKKRRHCNPLRLDDKAFAEFLIAERLAEPNSQFKMIAKHRCSCTCTDGCITDQCQCKIATFKEFCKFNEISESAAIAKGYPKGGWYQHDLLQGLDTTLPYEKQLRIFECSKGNKKILENVKLFGLPRWHQRPESKKKNWICFWKWYIF